MLSRAAQNAPTHSVRQLRYLSTGPSNPLPVVLCGKTEAIGRAVIQGLQPEYETIRFITSVDQGVNELPFLLADPISAPPPLPSSSSPSTTSPLGTHNFTRPPICVIFGGAWDSDMISAMRAACRERGQGVRSVPWLRPDLDKPAPPLGPAYGKAMVERVRAALQKMRDKGVTGDQVIWF